MNVDGPWFVEPDTSRVILFRGINLSGGTKLPVGIPSHQSEGFWVDHDRKVNFVGRPFPIEDADEHLRRLVDYGFNLLRYIVTWEAIEHEGPGIYDDEYIDYVIAVLEKCRNHGIKVFIDPHQDTWSRHCGGSGHPGWTHTLAGLDPAQFSATQAAVVHNLYPEPEKFPKMIWHTNHQKLAAATMFTLFFAGKLYAPKCKVNGIHVQDYLQNHYVRSLARLAKAIESNGLGGSVVIGYDTMNEPGQGYIGFKDITKLREDDVDFKKGLTPTALQGMLLGSGVPQDVDNWIFAWNGPRKEKVVRVDPGEARAWLSEADRAAADEVFGWKRAEEWSAGCIWALHGVYDINSQSVNKPDYFALDPNTGKPVDFNQHWLDFMKNYTSAILDISPDTILFLQPPIMETPPKIPSSLTKVAYAPHWYDGLTLVKKQWCNYNVDYINLKRGKYGTGPLRFLRALRVGEKAIRRCFVDQINTLKTEGTQLLGDYPFILGEIGIPYDMEDTVKPSMMYRLWSRLTSFFVSRERTMNAMNNISSPDSSQNKAMDASINAAENNLVSYALWTYLPDSHPKWGDLWNGEDLSIWQSSTAAAAETAKRVCSVDSLQEMTVKDSDTLYQEPLQSSSSKYEHQKNAHEIVCLHRPHPHKVAGIPISIQFTSPTYKKQAAFEFSFRPRDDEPAQGPTEIFVPAAYFPPPSSEPPTDVSVSHGTWTWDAPSNKYWIIRWSTENIDKELNVSLFKLNLTGVTA